MEGGDGDIISPEELAASRSAMSLTVLKNKPVHELVTMAESMGLENMARQRKQDVIFSILKTHARSGEDIYGDGVLEILQDGFGFLRSADSSYLAGPDDIYVSPSQIRRFNLRTGDSISGLIRPPKDGERYFALLKVGEINFDTPESARHKLLFENLTPLHPTKRLKLERGNGSTEDLTARMIDLMAPLGKGPARAHHLAAEGRQDDAAAEHRDFHHLEPPRRLPDRAAHRRAARGSDRDVAHGEGRGRGLDLRRAGEPARAGRRDGDREGEAAGRAQARRGRAARLDHAPRARLQHRRAELRQGADRRRGRERAAAPKRFFGAARNVEEGGSLTIIATALIDTGSRMDDVIYEEFKGTGNSEIHLDRRISEKRVFPAFNINRSGTRREELITTQDELAKIWILRKLLHPMDELAAVEFLLDKMKDTKTNAEFFDSMKRG